MPDLNDAKHQLAEALTEAGALPQWEPVTLRSYLDEPQVKRLRIPGGWLYCRGDALAFVPYVAGDADLRAAELQADNAYELMRAAENELAAARAQLHSIEEESGRLHGELRREQSAREQAENRCEELRREREAARAAADEWAAIARDMAGKPPAPTAEPCQRRAPANVGPSSYTMRGCRLAEGHEGPCEAT